MWDTSFLYEYDPILEKVACYNYRKQREVRRYEN
jgi:hypothetical protein